jgi:hypothetical protein
LFLLNALTHPDNHDQNGEWKSHSQADHDPGYKTAHIPDSSLIDGKVSLSSLIRKEAAV